MGGACSRKRDPQTVEENAVHGSVSRRYSKSGSSKWLGGASFSRASVDNKDGNPIPPSLMELCIYKISKEINQYGTFSMLPRDISQQIFNELVYSQRLTEAYLEAFQDCALQDINLGEYPGVDDTWMDVISSQGSSLLSADLSGSEVTDSGLFHILLPYLLGQEDVEKKCVMRLSQRMVTHFCSNISFHNNMEQQLLSSVPGPQNPVVYTVLHQSPYHDDTKEMVLTSATTFTLPHSPDFVFGILGDEHTRHETHWWIDNEVVLQEASVNRSGSLLVWSVLKSDEFELVRGGLGPRLPLVRLSGLAISSNCHQNAISSSNTGGGSIVTLGAQHEAHDIKELEPKMRAFVLKCIRATVDRIEAVLNKAAARTVSSRDPRFNSKLTSGAAGRMAA